jgi:hypothetical protein
MTNEEYAYWARNSIQSSNANALKFNHETGKLERILPPLGAAQIVELHCSNSTEA